MVQVRSNSCSPYVVKRDREGQSIEFEGTRLSAIEWVERPPFYSDKSVGGTPLTSIGELVGEDCLSICHTNACITFADGKQCAFCNLNFTFKQYDETIVRKRAGEVGELAAAAFRNNTARHFLITGGMLPGNREMEVLLLYLEAIRDATGMTVLPGVAIISPPENLDDLQRLADLGLHGVGFNLECLDRDFFRAVCPGKEQRVGYDRYRDALRAAVQIFGGGGRIFSGFVAGIEPMECSLDGVQELAEEGIAGIPLIWSPSAGTRFHGHRPPCAEWYVDLTERTASILVRSMKRGSGPPPRPQRCTRCHNQSLLHDVIQSRTRLLQTLLN